jgi:PAS domain-containing protein
MRNQEIANIFHEIAELLEIKGEIQWNYGRGQIIRDDVGRPLRMVGVVMDITDRKRAEEALRESTEKYRTLVDQSTEAIMDKIRWGYEKLLEEEAKELVWMVQYNTIIKAYEVAEKYVKEIDYCGITSGSKVDKVEVRSPLELLIM